jgi:hypothetical protein
VDPATGQRAEGHAEARQHRRRPEHGARIIVDANNPIEAPCSSQQISAAACRAQCLPVSCPEPAS